ncbi:MAG: hypothetical protein FJW35_09025, partial [Acidobacteria bacterium]|nr:hypothetical protein [Acidobacteriota bacterium]
QYWPLDHLDLPPPEPYGRAVQHQPQSSLPRHRCISDEQGSSTQEQGAEERVPSLTLAGANFEFDKTFVLPTAKADMERIYQLKQQHAHRRLAVFGHTDAAGPDDYNNGLSLLRAQAAHAVLTRDTAWWLRRLDGASGDTEQPWGTREIQHMLQALGHYTRVVDGDYRDGTRRAVRAFQSASSLPVSTSGQLDGASRQRLVEAYMDYLVPGQLTAAAFFQDGGGRPAVFGCGEAQLVVATRRRHPANRRVVFVLRHREGAPVDLSKTGTEVPYPAWLAAETEVVAQPAPAPEPAPAGPLPPRKVPQYLEDQIEHCAELLTAVEQEWRRLTPLPDTLGNRRERKAIMALYGHVSHIVEDFFFHSCFVDKAWKRFGRPLPGGEDATHWKRVWERRLLRPEGMNNNTELSNSDSIVTDLILTGGFGAQDIFFTVKDALVTFSLHHGDVTQQWWYLVLPPLMQRVFRPYFNEPFRRRFYARNNAGDFANEDVRDQWFRDVRELVNNADRYLSRAEMISQAGGSDRIPDERSLHALREMCRIDREVYNRYTGTIVGVPDQICGCFAFLLEVLCQADEAVDQSDTQAQILDNLVDRVHPDNYPGTVRPTFNNAARENIGSHSLINKDNARKKPLFPAALNAATCVARYIAKVMVRQVTRQEVAAARFNLEAQQQSPSGATNTVQPPSNVDWLHLLQHFLCHPDECERQWHVEAMRNKDAPAHHVIKHIDQATVNARMQLAMERRLETQYRTYGAAAEARWQQVRQE